MKRFWLVLLSLGLVLAFSASAMAVDVKFSGSYFAEGMYLDKTALVKDTAADGGATAFYFQRLRVNADFVVSPGLKLVTQFDALSRVWGGERTLPSSGMDPQSLGTTAETENIAFRLAYISYASPIGLFEVGYIHDNVWGTAFGDSDINGRPTGGIEYILPIGQFVLGALVYKEADASQDYNMGPPAFADADSDKYVLLAVYNLNSSTNFGLLYSYSRVASLKPVGMMAYVNTLQPYVKAKIGPVKIEGEFWYGWGKFAFEDGIVGADQKIEHFQGYLNAMVDFGIFYAGALGAYVSGDDPNTTDKLEGGLLGGGTDFNPCLIMFNQDLTYWMGPIPGYSGTANESQLFNSATNGGMQNAWIGQLKGGVRPIPALDIMAAVAYAQADKKPAGILNNAYGWEIDVTGTYKITNNLSYMLGIGYWFVGDYYKGDTNTNSLRDDYLLINKLTLTF